MVSVRWTGAAGLEFSTGGDRILIDPYYSRCSKGEVFLKPLLPKKDIIKERIDGKPGRLSAVIAGHTHFDHALDIPFISESCDGAVIGSRSLDSLLRLCGMRNRVTVCRGNERIELDRDITLTMLPSRHGLVLKGEVPYPGEIAEDGFPPLRARQYRLGTMFMPKLKIGDVTFLHAGSANLMESALEGHQCDVLFMCVPGWEKVPAYTTRLLDMVRPEIIIPFHFDDFTAPVGPGGEVSKIPLINMSGFLDRIESRATGAVIRVPRVDEVMKF